MENFPAREEGITVVRGMTFELCLTLSDKAEAFLLPETPKEEGWHWDLQPEPR